jgi:hypothetical protein
VALDLKDLIAEGVFCGSQSTRFVFSSEEEQLFGVGNRNLRDVCSSEDFLSLLTHPIDFFQGIVR